MKGNRKAPIEPTHFISGPSILPGETLLQFLQAPENQDRKLKIPVYIQYSDIYPGTVGTAFIAVNDQMPTKDRIYLRLDDSTMGIPLTEHLREYLPGEVDGPLWIIGIWGSPFDDPLLNAFSDPGKDFEEYPVTIRGVEGFEEKGLTNEEVRIGVAK